jgi:hypothetical protein
MSRRMTDGGELAHQVVDDLAAERWHEAYQSTSRRFRQKMDEAAFQRFVQESPPLAGPVRQISFNVLLASGNGTTHFEGSGQAPKGGIWLLLVAEDETLKVDRIALGDKTVP